ncbi:MAG: 4Fe-4S binding protein [Bacillota bacterium]|nr:4Fe-4S binding protein [Bacillota bacterium]
MARTRVVLNFPAALVEKPVTYHLVRDFGLVVNILRAEIRPGEAGTLLFELDDRDGQGDLQGGLEFVAREGVRIQTISGRITIDQDACLDCGACIGPCFAGALALDPTSYKLLFDDTRCVLCKVCVEACPAGAIKVAF